MSVWQSSPRTVNEAAFDRLRELLFAGEIEVGSRLDERTLSERIGVSRTPLREAIAQLVSIGVAEHIVYRGTFVRTFTARQVVELYDVRKALEGLAARTAATLATSADIERLDAVITSGSAAFARGDNEGFERSDREFHDLVAEIAGNSLLIEELDRLSLRIQLVRHLANLHTSVASDSIDDRHEVLAAIREGDQGGAEAAMVRHIDRVQHEAARSLQTHG